jgi:hypothetical protein
MYEIRGLEIPECKPVEEARLSVAAINLLSD